MTDTNDSIPQSQIDYKNYDEPSLIEKYDDFAWDSDFKYGYPFYTAICYNNEWLLNKRQCNIFKVDISLYNKVGILSTILTYLQYTLTIISIITCSYTWYDDINSMRLKLKFNTSWQNFQCYSLIVCNSSNCKNVWLSMVLLQSIHYQLSSERLNKLSKFLVEYYRVYGILTIPIVFVFTLPFIVSYIWISFGVCCIFACCGGETWLNKEKQSRNANADDKTDDSMDIQALCFICCLVLISFSVPVMIRLYNGESYWHSFVSSWDYVNLTIYWNHLKEEINTIITFINWIF